MLRRYLLATAALGFFGGAVSANTVTISAVASLTGLAHFQSDVRVFNRSFDTPVHVTATYYCATAPCGNSPQTFDLSPRHSMAFDDIAANLFNAPGSQGAVVFEADADELVATSRLYSISTSGDFVGGSLGQFVPGLEDEDAYPISVLTSLRNSSDSHTGFRSHITAFNTSGSATAHVKFALFDGGGASLGTFSVSIVPHGFQPALAIFSVAGASATNTENAYCAVTSDQPIFVAASILDNITQDTIFVTGAEDDQGSSTTAPGAAFTFAPPSPTAGQAVSFTDTSTGAPTSWSWDFGDQTAADTTQNPTHIFSLPGPYTVTLTASNAGGSGAHSEQLTVAAAGSPPVAKFSFAPSGPTAGQSVTFTDASTGSPTSWSWNFGDPGSGASNTSAAENPSHTYSSASDYTVSLTATNAFGPSMPTTKTVHVTSAGSPPTAKFTFSPANPTPSTSVSFTDASTGSPTSWSWNFGDPASGGSNGSTSQNPTHTFSGTGTFNVILTATNGFGPSAPAQKSVTVGVPPTASFTFLPPSPTAGSAVVFTDTTTGSPTSWTWNFGDPLSGSANTSTLQNPSHVFANASTYTVTLSASNKYGSSGNVHEDVVVGAAAAPTILVVNIQEWGYNNCNPIVVHQGQTYQIQFHALDNGQNGAGHGFSGVASLGLSEHHNISTAADYMTEVFTPAALGTHAFHCTAHPDCGNQPPMELCHTGHSTMVGSIEVDP